MKTKTNHAEIEHEFKGNDPKIGTFGNSERQRKTIPALRYAIIALIFGVTIAAIANADNVIVKNGQLNVSNDVHVDGVGI